MSVFAYDNLMKLSSNNVHDNNLSILVIDDNTKSYLVRNNISISDPKLPELIFDRLASTDVATVAIINQLVNQFLQNVSNSEIIDYPKLTDKPLDDSKLSTVRSIANKEVIQKGVLDFLNDSAYELNNDNHKYFEVLTSTNELHVIVVKRGFFTFINTVGMLVCLREIISLVLKTQNSSDVYLSGLYRRYLTLLNMSTK